MLNVKKDFIGAKGLELFRGKEKEEKSINAEINDMLKVLLQDGLMMRSQQEQWKKETKEFREKIDKQFAEINSTLRYSLTEQEKLKIKTATTEELSRLILDNQLEMRKNIDTLIEKVGEING